tara:strand:- start:546 stop:1217 length:672 start_codon:yes stop_codon:yes gene_type:complete
MKKLSLIIISGLYLFTSAAFAEIGVNIGVSGSAGIFGATGEETHSGKTAASITSSDQATEIAAVGYGSIFIEKELGMIAIGIDYVPTPFESETAETAKQDDQTSNPTAAVKTVATNTVQVDMTDLTTVYVSLMVTENAYIKAGYATMDVETNENLGTGSSYGNTSLDGTVYGVGYQKDLDAMFVRVEGSYMDFDGVSLTANDNTIKLKALDGVTGKISIGKTF